MTVDEMMEVMAAHGAAERACDAEATMATMSEDCYQEHPALRLRCEGQVACRRYYEETMFVPFPDHGAERFVTTVGENTVILEVRLFGKMRGPWMGLPPTELDFSFPMTVVVRFRAGKILGETWYYDSATLCEQLGYERDEVLAAAERLSNAAPTVR